MNDRKMVLRVENLEYLKGVLGSSLQLLGWTERINWINENITYW